MKLYFLSAVFFSTALAQNAIVQNDGSPSPQIRIQTATLPPMPGLGIEAAIAGPLTTVAGAPYSAQTTTERVQTLADGNRIQQSSSGSVARDSQGRVRREESLPNLSGSTSDAPRLVRIEDPVAGVHWTLDAQTKTAIKMPFPTLKTGLTGGVVPPPPSGRENTFFYSSSVPGGKGGIEIITKTLGAPEANTTKTDLGTQTVEGLPAQGTRITRIIPAGAAGNEQPITITTETWYSPDLHILLMSKSTDPRIGETTYRLTDIQRAEPAAASFQIPDDYTVKDQPVNTMIFQKTGKMP